METEKATRSKLTLVTSDQKNGVRGCNKQTQIKARRGKEGGECVEGHFQGIATEKWSKWVILGNAIQTGSKWAIYREDGSSWAILREMGQIGPLLGKMGQNGPFIGKMGQIGPF